MKQLVLASNSPRRKSLLEKAGLSFTIDPSDVPEPMDMSKDPKMLAIDLSRAKAQEVAKRHKNAIILAADTFVILDGKYLGKPKDRKEAEEMLAFQSGKMQEIVTAFTLLDTDTKKTISDAAMSRLYMKRLTPEQIAQYLDKNTYMDKAGAYAIQEVGNSFIEKIDGDYDTIVGLPTQKVVERLQEFAK